MACQSSPNEVVNLLGFIDRKEPPPLFHGEVQQGIARQDRELVHKIRTLRHRRDPRTRLSQQGDATGVAPGTRRRGTHRKTVHPRKRYRRYTYERKQVAVDHYLEHGRRLKRTMPCARPSEKPRAVVPVDRVRPNRS